MNDPEKPWTPGHADSKVLTIRVTADVYTRLVAETHRRKMRMSDLLREWIMHNLESPSIVDAMINVAVANQEDGT